MDIGRLARDCGGRSRGDGMRRWARWGLRGTAALVVLFTAAWGALALWFRLPGEEATRMTGAVLFAVAGGLAIIAILRGQWRAPGLYAVAFLVLMGWWSTIRPSHDRNWDPVAGRMPELIIDGDRLEVRNLRDFAWRTESDFTPTWTNRTYDLSKVEGVDVFLSYWMGPAIAHLIVSFPFTDQPPLAFSIEIRREQGEQFSALAGFFKQFELIIIAADERDIIRLRTNVWKEDVRLYRLSVGVPKARAAIEAYAAEIAALKAEPQWYDTLGGNCTTIVFRLARSLWPELRLDWRIILSGHLPSYLHEIGAVDTSMPLAELMERAKVSARGQASDDANGVALPDFSARIREGVPLPR